MKTTAGVAKLTPLQWAICTIAVIGFAFDTFEILMLPLILQPAIVDLTHFTPGSADTPTGREPCFTYRRSRPVYSGCLVVI